MNLLNVESYERIVALIRRVPMKRHLSSLKIVDIASALGRDKKHVGTKLRFVLPIKIGKVKIVDDVTPRLIQRAVKEIRKR